MNSRLHFLAGTIMVMLVFVISCSTGGLSDSNPTTPDITRNIEADDSGHYLWAYYNIYVDPVEDIYEVVPLRQVADHWNILKFLEQGPCYNCVEVVAVQPTPSGTREWTVNINHPFPSANLTGFDIRGIAMFAGSKYFPMAGLTTPDRTVGDGELVNADGHTTLYNAMTAGSGPGGLQGYLKGKYTPPLTPNALLNGYKRHISPGADGRNMFYAGTSVAQVYELDMPDSAFVFGYAVDASWAKATNLPVTNPLTDFPPEANCPEPWNIMVTEEVIGQGLHDQGGQTKLILDVYDHQGKISYFPPVVECPDLFGGTANAIFTVDGTDYSRYEVTVNNENIVEMGEYQCLISIEDTANATAPEWLDLTAYKVIILTVAEFVPQDNLPPTAGASVDNANPQAHQLINFTDESTDPDGIQDIVLYEWDFDYNILDGFDPAPPVEDPSIQYPDPGTYYVHHRVEDTEGHFDFIDDPIEIVVGGSSNYPPTAGAFVDNEHPATGEWVHFTDASNDPDGYTDIVQFHWDIDEDMLPDLYGVSPMYKWTDGGDYPVQHRVIDTAENEDWLDEPILIEVNAPPEVSAEADTYTPDAGQVVTITNTSQDLDGNGAIEEVYWDMDGNGEYDDPEDIQDQDVLEIQLYEGGTHYIGLKVVDEHGLESELDNPLEIYVEPLPAFCIDLIDQWNSADHLYQTRTFRYFQGAISELDVNYQDANGPWDFTNTPVSQPAICEWFTIPGLDEPTPGTIWPDADFFFKEAAPIMGGAIYAPHRFDFIDGINGDLVLQGQWQPLQTFDYGEVFEITHPICHPWFDGGAGTGSLSIYSMDIVWSMETLGTGWAILPMGLTGETPVQCILIRHNINLVITDLALNISLLNYQWIDFEGNEVAFMEATKGIDGTHFSGNTYIGEVICRPLIAIS